MVSWSPKDPDAVLDYVYTIPLDDSDAVGSFTFERLDGTVAIDSTARSGADVTAWLSGGADGETSVFRIAWITTGGRTDQDIITLPIAEVELAALDGYAVPTAGHLLLRYPELSGIPTATLSYWLKDAARSVDESWSQGDFAPAIMALAAHRVAVATLGSDIPVGVNRLRSGSLDIGFSDALVRDRAGGALASTSYGVEFLAMQRRNRGGPLITATGADIGGAYDGRWGSY